MVKLARPKANITDRIRARNKAIGIIAKKSGKPNFKAKPEDQPKSSDDTSLGSDGYPKNKGMYLGSCNRSACLKPSAIWFNHSTRKYYCVACAHWLNSDVFNRRDAHEMYGHELCTEGRHDDQWDYRYNKPLNEVVKFPEDYKISEAGSLTILRPSIEKKYFDDFMETFKRPGGRYARLRLGQAFYNHFNLHKMNHSGLIHALYEKDGAAATAAIHDLFEVH